MSGADNKKSPSAKESESSTVQGGDKKKIPTTRPSSSYATTSHGKKSLSVSKPSSLPSINDEGEKNAPVAEASGSSKKSGNVFKPRKALYDGNGVHIESGQDICDCLYPECSGCFNKCTKCGSTKCGPACRNNRKYTYDSIDYEATNITRKFEDLFKKTE